MLFLTVALRIQVSEDCKEILDGLGNYEFEDRGQVEVKVCQLLKGLLHRRIGLHNIANVHILITHVDGMISMRDE